MHCLCGIGCGGGKSLAWILPIIQRTISGCTSKMNIVIIPYCFLLKHHYTATTELIQATHNFNVEALTGRDIEDNILPNYLRDRETLPALLFISLEGIAKLLKYH